ncbi:MAG TPA: recombination mediator RecR [Planctomycetota bacterium]|nr:recombination mediator RecR [Planctomycetota bacterium]
MARARVVEHLMQCLARLPGVGPKTSERLAYWLLRTSKDEALGLARAIEAARDAILVCRQCFNLDEVDPCSVCADPQRDRDLILVVEDPRDVAAFEEAEYRGVYHVLQGRLSSLEGVGPDDLTVAALLARVRAQPPREVCLATNPDLEGEATARMLAAELSALGVTVTRLARGLPAGATIQHVAKSVLLDAIEGRRRL